MDGAYHGHADVLLVAAGSGAATLGIPGSAGVPPGVVNQTLVLPHNDIAAFDALMAKNAYEIAAVIVEPVAGNMGCVPPREGWLQRLREATEEHGIVLIFDEVMTGFRLARGGAQELYGITPDLTALGKIVGGGLPVAAYGGKREIMERVAPLGPVYQAGTLSGNPLGVAAGLATLKILEQTSPWPQLDERTRVLADGLVERAKAAGVPYTGNRVGSMFTGFFRDGEVWNYEDAKQSDLSRFAQWHGEMLARGVYFAPSQFEAGFVSIAHDDAIIESTLSAAEAAFAAVAEAK
jgi:glutamate-1-semialdehyde 2,1-aminomutase